MDIAHYQRNRFFHASTAVRTELTAKTIDAEMSPAGGEVSRSNLTHLSYVHYLIIGRGRKKRAAETTARLIERGTR